MNPSGTVTETDVRDWCQANGMVLVSRQFWVAAANAIRRVAGHVTAMSGGLTDAEAWDYVRQRAANEIADLLQAWAANDERFGGPLRSAATAVRTGVHMTRGYVEP